jgi:hypothetical protein
VNDGYILTPKSTQTRTPIDTITQVSRPILQPAMVTSTGIFIDQEYYGQWPLVVEALHLAWHYSDDHEYFYADKKITFKWTPFWVEDWPGSYSGRWHWNKEYSYDGVNWYPPYEIYYTFSGPNNIDSVKFLIPQITGYSAFQNCINYEGVYYTTFAYFYILFQDHIVNAFTEPDDVFPRGSNDYNLILATDNIPHNDNIHTITDQITPNV